MLSAMSLVSEIGDALDALTDAANPLQEVAAVAKLERLVHRARRQVMRNAIAATSYSAVARVYGTSRQAIRQSFPDVRPGQSDIETLGTARAATPTAAAM